MRVYLVRRDDVLRTEEYDQAFTLLLVIGVSSAGIAMLAAGCVLAGSERVASQPATAAISSGDRRSVMLAMQSGAAALRWPVRQAPNWLIT